MPSDTVPAAVSQRKLIPLARHSNDLSGQCLD